MDPHQKANLILHPVRLQILHVLAGRTLTTTQISSEIPHAPLSSIYRHLKRLLDGGMVQVVKTIPVRGVEEKAYALAQVPRITADDVAQMSQSENLRYFASYLATLLDGFALYLASSTHHDFMAERAGFNDYQFYASAEEMDTMREELNKQLRKLMAQSPSKGRLRRRFSFVSHPIDLTPQRIDDPSK